MYIYINLVSPEQTEDGAPCGEGDQRQTVTQSVQRLHGRVEDQLQRHERRQVSLENMKLAFSSKHSNTGQVG